MNNKRNLAAVIIGMTIVVSFASGKGNKPGPLTKDNCNVLKNDDCHISKIPAINIQQNGNVPEEAQQENTLILSVKDEDHFASIYMDINLENVPYSLTPSSRIQVENLISLRKKDRGRVLGALHILNRGLDNRPAQVIGATIVRPAGIPFSYSIDITDAVNQALRRPKGKRKLNLELRLAGEPTFATVYSLPTKTEKTPLSLEIISPDGWINDWSKRVEPVTSGTVIYRESCLPLAENRDSELPLRLLYPAEKIIEVICSSTGQELQKDRDWILQDGQLVLPVGSHAPIQLRSEFFTFERTDKEGNTRTITSKIRLQERTWYHERQIEVTYEPVLRDWSFPASASTLDDLPRLKGLLATKSPVKVVLFGDSISFGGNASRLTDIWPYQPSYGQLTAWKLQEYYGSKVIFMNHSRSGATSKYAVEQAQSLVGYFKPDLAIIAFGMNDRAPSRREVFYENMQKAISSIREMSPETEFILVASMMNNPDQSTGIDPILAIRNDVEKLASNSGMAFVDITTTQKEMLDHKNYLDLSGNGANHPNDFLHRIYAQRICEVLIPSVTKYSSFN